MPLKSDSLSSTSNVEPSDELSLAEETPSSSSSSSSKFTPLEVRLSQTLHRKLVQKAEMEGVELDEFIRELLAEGLVLRAFEIAERKNTMQKNPQNGSFSGGQRQNGRFRQNQGSGNGPRPGANGKDGGQNGNGGFRPRNGQGQMVHGRRLNYNQIMDDNANFLEYVRSQEKKQK